MRLRYALPLLGLSAAFMAGALSLAAEAAAQPQRNVRVRPPGTPAPGADGEGGEGEALAPFETGTDFEPVSPRTRVTFNLEDADLPDLVRLVSSGTRFVAAM